MIPVGLARSGENFRAADASEELRGENLVTVYEHTLRALPDHDAGAGSDILATRWLSRLKYLAMSCVVVWHTLAIVIAPAPTAGEMVQFFRAALQPYLTFLKMDNQWSFFAPKVGRGGESRYVVEAADGKRHVFIPSEMPRESLSHLYLWREWKYFFDKLNESADTRGYLVAGLLCKQYSDLKPVSVTFLRVEERDFSAEDFRQGFRPQDSRFINVKQVAKFEC
jgi:hypothetical protein